MRTCSTTLVLIVGEMKLFVHSFLSSIFPFTWKDPTLSQNSARRKHQSLLRKLFSLKHCVNQKYKIFYTVCYMYAVQFRNLKESQEIISF